MLVHITTLQYIILGKIKFIMQMLMFLGALAFVYEKTGFVVTLLIFGMYLLTVVVEDLFANLHHVVQPYEEPEGIEDE